MMLLLFALAEWKDFLRFFIMLWPWAAGLLAAGYFLKRPDRREGIRFLPHLKWTEVVFLFIAAFIVLAFYASGFNSWKYAFIGDEYAFYWRAEELLEEGLLKLNWFEASGVYGDHPLALSGWQAVFLGIFGRTNFAWRLSAAVLTVICLPPLYLLLRRLLWDRSPAPRAGAALGCALFFFSELIIVWSRIGQQPNSGLVALIFAPCAFFAARQRNSRLLYFVAGVIPGLGLFFNTLGTVVCGLFFGGVLLADIAAGVFRQRRLTVSLFIPALLVLSGFIMAGAFNLVQLDYYQHLAEKNLMSKEDPGTFESKSRKTLQAVLSPLFYRAGNHFLRGNVFGPLTAFLFACAFGVFRRMGWKNLLMIFWLLLIGAIMTAGLSQYVYPPVTRILLLVFPVAVLAALGFHALPAGRRTAWVLAPVLALVAIGWNAMKHQEYNPYKQPVPYQMLVIQRLQHSPPDSVHVFVFPQGKDPYFCRTMTEIYGYGDRTHLLNETPEGLKQLVTVLNTAQRPVLITPVMKCRKKAEIQSLAGRSGQTVLPGIPHYGFPGDKPPGRQQWWQEAVEGVRGFLDEIEPR
jgi:4-amino-4-deoxy-L-arabinose transferase-like glycosyltransferase